MVTIVQKTLNLTTQWYYGGPPQWWVL